MSDDPRLDALRYAISRGQDTGGSDGASPEREPGQGEASADRADASTEPKDSVRPVPRDAAAPSPGQISSYVELSIQQAIRSGAFDNLPGAGKPLPKIVSSRDPEWWIRQKIANERLTGLAPAAFTLRTEHAEFAERMDALATEEQVREAVEDFDRRVVEARRQLLGGPPVVTPLHDADDEVRAWRERRRCGGSDR